MSAGSFTTERTRLQSLCGDTSAATQTYIDQFNNEAYQQLASEMDWSWLRFRGTVNLVGTYATGSLAATAGSPTLTGSGTLWQTNLATTYELEIAREIYGITTIVNETEITANRNAVVAAAAGSAYTAFRRTYALGARLRGTPVFRVSTATDSLPLKLVGWERIETMAQPQLLYSPPLYIAFVEDDSSGNQQVMVYPIPSAACTLIYYGYRQVVDLTSGAFLFRTEHLPAFRHLADSKLWHWRKDLARMNLSLAFYKAALDRLMLADASDTGRGDELPLDPQRFAQPSIFRNDINRVQLGGE